MKHYMNSIRSLKMWGQLLLLLLLPNILMLCIAKYTNMARPLINTDYIVAAILFTLPFKSSRIMASLVLAISILFDITMFIMQIFPFMDLGAFISLMPFITIAPTEYMILSIVGLCYIMLMCFGIFKISKTLIYPKTQAMILGLLLVIAYPLSDWKYYQHGTYSGMYAQSNHFVIHSQIGLLRQLQTGDLATALNTLPNLQPYPENKQRAITHLQQPYSNKILLIIAESWGAYRQPAVRDNILSAILKENHQKIEVLDNKNLDILNSNTIAAEMRELCNYRIEGGYAFHRLDQQKFAHCLPNLLKKQHYQTISFLGMSGILYDNYDWYHKAGFEQSSFLETLPKHLKKCHAFHAVCDTEMPKLIGQAFQPSEQKQFVYWLTVSAHAPFYLNDVQNKNRFNCQEAGMLPDGDICRNAKLNAQLFDSIATLIHHSNMKGVEVIVVGDHMPPLFMGEDTRPHIRYHEVGFLHFVIK